MSVQTVVDQKLLAIGYEYLSSVYNEAEGRVVCPEAPGYLALRETLQWALALILTGDVERADSVVLRAPYSPCHFSPMVALHLVVRHGEALTHKAQQQLEKYVLEQIPFMQRVRLREGNVNQPLMAAAVLGVAGERYEKGEWREEAAARLEALRRQLSDTGSVSEYNSPTYQAVSLAALAFLAENAKDPSLQCTAQVLLERLWLDTVLHFHEPTGIVAGPYSRAYADNSTGRFSLLALLNLKLLPTPEASFFDPREAIAYDHGHDLGFTPLFADLQVSLPTHFIAGLSRHIPQQLVSKTRCTPYVKGGEAYPGGEAELVTYSTSAFALATASRPYSDGGQCEGFYLQWRRHEFDRVPPGVAYMRYVVNDAQVDAPNYNEELDTRFTRSLLLNQGRWYALQRGHRALVLYHPKRCQPRFIHALSLQVLLPGFSPTELWLGGQCFTGDDLERELTAPADQALVWVDGLTTVGLRPLAVTDAGGGGSWRIRAQGRHMVLGLENYRGAAREFSPAELTLMENGLLVEVYHRDEVDPEALWQQLQGLSVSVEETSAGLRTVSCQLRDGEWLLAYDPFLQMTFDRLVDGAPVFTPPFRSESVCQGEDEICLHGVSLAIPRGTGLIATSDGKRGMAMKLSRGSQVMRLAGDNWSVACVSEGISRIGFVSDDRQLRLDIVTSSSSGSVEVRASHATEVSINGVRAETMGDGMWATAW